MMRRATRVVKVGGSLLDYGAFLPAWNRWLAEQPPAANVLIAGGGKLADVIRQADRIWGLGEEAAHGLCIDVLAVSARLLAAVLGPMRRETSWQRLRQWLDRHEFDESIVFCPVQFLREAEAALPPRPLPHTWHVTSDSIAARIAGVLSADELVLLKSADPPAHAPLRPPYVDEYFEQAARHLSRVSCVNLRRYA